MTSRSAAALLLASILVLVGCTDDEPRPEPAPPGPAKVAPLWEAELIVRPSSSDDVSPVVPADGAVVLVGGSSVVARDRTSGQVRWEWPVPDGDDVCASAPVARDAVAVLIGIAPRCDRVVAVDAATGRTAWTARIPRALDGVRHPEVSLGTTSVVVTGYCAGFARFDARTGASRGVQQGAQCSSSSASDGTAVVTSRGARLARFDAATGRRTAKARVPGVVRVGEVVSSDPLVVTALVDRRSATGKGCALVDWSAPTPVVFGLREAPRPASFGALWGCEVTSSALVGDRLWLDDGASLTGHDLATHEPTAHLASRDARLLGLGDQELVLADPVAGTSTHLALALPDDPSGRRDLGVLVGADAEPVLPAIHEPRPLGAVAGDTALVLLRDVVVAYPISPQAPDKEQP